jgi:hypothetical protein
MDESYTAFWTQQSCRTLGKHSQEGTPLTLLFGGPHTSEPSFRRAGVTPGDWIYPVRVLKGTMYVLARMRVQRILSLDEWIAAYPHLFVGCEPSDPRTFFTDEFLANQWLIGALPTTLAGLHSVYPELSECLPSATNKAAIDRYVRDVFERWDPARRRQYPTFADYSAYAAEIQQQWGQRVAEVNAWTEERIRGLQASEAFRCFFRQHPELGYLAPSCTSEVVIGEEGTPIWLDVAVPPDLLLRLRYRSRRAERSIKYIEDGRLKSVLSLQGIYRLSPSSAAEVAALLNNANTATSATGHPRIL